MHSRQLFIGCFKTEINFIIIDIFKFYKQLLFSIIFIRISYLLYLQYSHFVHYIIYYPQQLALVHVLRIPSLHIYICNNSSLFTTISQY